MAKISCFSAILAGKKKRSKDSPKTVDLGKMNSDLILGVKAEEFVSLAILTPVATQKESSVELVDDKNLVKVDSTVEAAYEGGDERDDILSMKRDFSDVDLQAKAEGKGELNCHHSIESNYELNKDGAEITSERDEGITPEVMIQSGHVSDPGMVQKTALWGSPSLKRSCSNIETKRASKLLASPKKSHSRSYDNLQNLSSNAAKEAISAIQDSPLSVKTSASADRIMLKKRSSSQVLPSRSRKLWWKLFLWSHRNLHNPSASKPQKVASANDGFEQKGGYTSDTLEASHQIDEKNKREMKEPQNQWVAFSAESSSLDRVNAWVNSLEDDYFCPNEDQDDQNYDGEVAGTMLYSNSSEIGESSRKNHHQAGLRAADEVLQANRVIQSLNTLSSVAHISGMGLKVIPAISAFTSLRAINLSGNFIVHISTGSLPKSLHTLDLSRNKIATIEGLKELTRLRILNLSYNRISRIGHGLSSCTAIKELYLAGNKISNVEGLHRLLKLTILDMSFNKITTAKALGQLVANYNSLLALNLLGNPIQSNIGDDQLRKAVTGLLPHLTYLNKQPIKLHRAREVATDSVARAALGNDGRSFRRKSARRVGQGLISSIKSNAGEGSSRRGLGGGVAQKSSRHRSRGSEHTARK
ncbi:uncharacterized protein [Typha latifolia]|uniref:uncharacterized protein isoform X1 n=1 Tax=Typha latifolia TaxID=4733 RepID=UPI003C2C1524